MVTTGRERAIRGIILKKVLYRETSLILDFFSRSEGRVSMLAKGSRGEKSRHTGLLELLNELEAVVYMNRESSWIIFKSAELIKSHLYEVNFQTSTLLQAAAELYL
ncbi:MAG: recombination protein O N-terminal domain-containing protein, partial [Candidatus Cloacimonetes bacterium]|nr:recombination protein O N-terminal domain-containing protein [Candidatus Cloacimonadota bacterium]